MRVKLRHVVAAAAAGDDRLLNELKFGAPPTDSGLAKLDELRGGGRGPVAVLDSPVADMAGPLGAIAASADPAQRVQLALARWNPGFLEMIPRFADALHSRLRDVRVCYWREEGPALVWCSSPTTTREPRWA
ncbi:hypothetical protein [Mycobacteroides chelonae]|uniref:hypothetical protein n=1 Tax=Mycobacteroides chelonae TaxID=1774 RepID=UPI0010425419|nr:hypothetical protein [Mycobacteroides chelonae]